VGRAGSFEDLSVSPEASYDQFDGPASAAAYSAQLPFDSN